MDSLGINAAIAECQRNLDRIKDHIQHLDNGLKHLTEDQNGELRMDCTSGEKRRELAALKLQESYLAMYRNFESNVIEKTFVAN